ncbi:MAG: DUF1566 domain-containing protein [Desulfobacteraceae bacterium]|jgi:hypothetical protein
MKKHKQAGIVFIVVVLASIFSALAIAGDLEPSADPAPTMHSLEEIYNQNAEVETFLSWSKKITDSSRFQLVMDSEAVLDRETGLVWDRNPDTTKREWTMAKTHCYKREVANRFGWRLPTIEELATLIDNSNTDPALPSDHPFTNIQLDDRYWTMTTVNWLDTYAWDIHMSSGLINENPKTNSYYCWCVRGGHGHDAY